MEPEVTCPKCGGKTWDNRETKKNPKAPDYKCRDKSCDGCVWPPKNGAAVAKPAPERVAYNTPKALPNEFDGYEHEETAELNAKTGRGPSVTPKIKEAATLWNAARLEVLAYAPDFANDWQALNAAIATVLIQSGKAA